MDDTLINYLITDPLYYTNDIQTFETTLREVLTKNQIHYACFRDKESENIEALAKIFIEVCKEFHLEQILLSEHFELAKKLGATGVHLTSRQLDKIKESKDLDLYVIASCHDYNAIEKAQKQHVNAITYSPIFETPKKPDPKGISKLKETIKIFEDVNIIALGGIITPEHVRAVSDAKAYGFASIRYFI